jgi:hypothetical protein
MAMPCHKWARKKNVMTHTRTSDTSLSEALLMVDRAIVKIPNLTTFGVGISYHFHRDGKEAVAEQIKEQQAALYKDACLRMIAVCADWIKLRLLRKSFDPRISSYGLKHLVEEYREGRGDPDWYVTNGCFIVDGVGLGFDFSVTGPNVVFEFRGRGTHVQ